MDLISASYGDSSDEETAASGVSSKRTFKDDECPERTLKKQAILFPRPKFHEDVIAEKHVDNPSKHGNRIRSFPHERGNWASHIYIPWECSQLSFEIIEHCSRIFIDFGIELTRIEDLHISLTRTIVLRHHWIQDFVSSFRKAVGGVDKFQTMAKNFSTYTNDDKTRTFLAFDVFDFSDSLNILVKLMDACLLEYKLPTYYENPSHHVSFAWCVGDRKADIDRLINQLELTPGNTNSTATSVHCKIGNQFYACNLR